MNKKHTSKTQQISKVPGFTLVKKSGGISEHILKTNGLRVLHLERPGTGIVTTNITYFVGSRDEARGETGAAHMLEHMLFKPTVHDIQRGQEEADSMLFDRETGCIVNANTWKDRTTYYFSYPTEYLDRALRIESERMSGVLLNDKTLTPEQNNVLSEYDMYNGDPYFALSVNMTSAAYVSHTYGHETIGYREDIERYTAATLEHFYRLYYRPDNAILMIVGDVDEKTALTRVKKHFSTTEKPVQTIPRFHIAEPKQEGIRRITVERPSETNVVAIGVKHPGFPNVDWHKTSMLFEVLTDGPESILHRALVDSGIAISVEGSLEPTKEENIGAIIITLADGKKHAEIEQKVLEIISTLTTATIAPLLKNAKAKALTDEAFARDSSMRIVAELTEYASAGDWTLFNKTIEVINAITPAMVLEAARTRFTQNTMTIGYFIGTKK